MSFSPSARRLHILALSLFASATLAGEAPSARAMQGRQDGPETYAPVPFAPGETASYQVRLGGVTVGRGSMEVVGMESVSGKATYHARLRLAGGVPLARVDDKLDTWIDAQGLFSRRFRQDQKEVRYERKRSYDFFPETRTYRRTDKDETGTIPTSLPLDDVSFLYYARTLPLAVGDVYTIERYFNPAGNPVVLKVLRRETVTVPAGRFQTVVVRPIIQTRGLFGEGGEAEVYFTDDARRILVQLRSKVPLVGSLTMHLTAFRAGVPIPGAPTSAFGAQ